MKTFIPNALILGGIYFVISIFGLLIENNFMDIINIGLSLIFITLLIILSVKKNFKFIEQLQQKSPRICNYLKALGFAEYVSFFFAFIPGIISGYTTTTTEYTNETRIPAYPAYIDYLTYAWLIILVIALLWATYTNFKKKEN